MFGLGEVYTKIIIAVLAVTALIGAGYLVEREWSKAIEIADEKGYERGKQETDAAYKGRDNKQLQTVIAERDKLIAEAREREAKHDLEIGQQEEAHATASASQDAKYNALLARYRGLQRQPGTAGACPSGGDQGRPGEAPTDSSGSARQLTRGELLGADGEVLIREAKRADDKLAALKLCRSTLLIERE